MYVVLVLSPEKVESSIDSFLDISAYNFPRPDHAAHERAIRMAEQERQRCREVNEEDYRNSLERHQSQTGRAELEADAMFEDMRYDDTLDRYGKHSRRYENTRLSAHERAARYGAGEGYYI